MINLFTNSTKSTGYINLPKSYKLKFIIHCHRRDILIRDTLGEHLKFPYLSLFFA